MRRTRATLVSTILMTAFLVSSSAPGLAAATVSVPDRRPVIIVSEPSFGSDLSMSASTGALARHLASVGYTPGRDLFEIGISGVKDLPDGALQLAVHAKEVLGSAPECDMVASGISGFIARYAVENDYLEGVRIANLVMVASPNHGTFLAGVVKSILEVVRQESFLEKETRGQRFFPSVREILGLQDNEDAKSVKELTQARSLAAPEWEDEASWIAYRSASLWEPLYAQYVKGRYFSIPYVPADSPKETFAGWVRRSLPAVWERLFVEAEWPKGAAQDLSLPYYEYLSMEVARNRYVMRTASGGSLVQSLISEPYVPSGWKDAAYHYGLKILRHYAEKALVTLKAKAQELIAERAVGLTGLGDGPDSPFISGLVKEDLLINLGTSAAKRFERIPANLRLQALNKSSQSAARNRDTRYVSVSSRLANPWGLIWPQLAPNDGLLEVDSTVAPVGPGDLIRVFGGILRLPGKDILDDNRVQRYIAEVLGESVETSGVEGGSLISLDVSSWGPQRCAIGNAERVTIGVTDLPEGWQCQVWEEGGQPAAMWAFGRGGNYTVRLSPGTGSLGLRLIRTGPANPVLGRSVSSAYAEEVFVRVFVALSKEEIAPVEPPETDPPGSGDEGVASPGDVEDDDLPDDIPTVRVVYRSKHTTLKKAKETVHKYWMLDFGDGTREKVDGMASLTVDHTYTAPGSYRVIAESYGDGDEPLYTKTWEVSAYMEGETHRFACQSIAPIKVEVILNGPRKWVTGKRAVFTAGANVELPPNAELVSLKIDPGETFGVIWERAGDFVVGCAASMIVQYSLEDALIKVENTYLKEVPVTVLTTGVTQ
ncbi:MAG: hypothetical protein ACOX5M_06905 [Bacillota bacterium]